MTPPQKQGQSGFSDSGYAPIARCAPELQHHTIHGRHPVVPGQSLALSLIFLDIKILQMFNDIEIKAQARPWQKVNGYILGVSNFQSADARPPTVWPMAAPLPSPWHSLMLRITIPGAVTPAPAHLGDSCENSTHCSSGFGTSNRDHGHDILWPISSMLVNKEQNIYLKIINIRMWMCMCVCVCKGDVIIVN